MSVNHLRPNSSIDDCFAYLDLYHSMPIPSEHWPARVLIAHCMIHKQVSYLEAMVTDPRSEAYAIFRTFVWAVLGREHQLLSSDDWRQDPTSALGLAWAAGHTHLVDAAFHRIDPESDVTRMRVYCCALKMTQEWHHFDAMRERLKWGVRSPVMQSIVKSWLVSSAMQSGDPITVSATLDVLDWQLDNHCIPDLQQGKCMDGFWPYCHDHPHLVIRLVMQFDLTISEKMTSLPFASALHWHHGVSIERFSPPLQDALRNEAIARQKVFQRLDPHLPPDLARLVISYLPHTHFRRTTRNQRRKKAKRQAAATT
jgi:hypothetical protein